jgi:hypothetical protein
MGGKGSGRPMKTENIIKRVSQPQFTPIASQGTEGLYIPNHSGIASHPEAKRSFASGGHIHDHTTLTNIGTNTHAQIDTHVALTNEHIDWTNASENLVTTGNVSGGHFEVGYSGSLAESKTLTFNQGISSSSIHCNTDNTSPTFTFAENTPGGYIEHIALSKNTCDFFQGGLQIDDRAPGNNIGFKCTAGNGFIYFLPSGEFTVFRNTTGNSTFQAESSSATATRISLRMFNASTQVNLPCWIYSSGGDGRSGDLHIVAGTNSTTSTTRLGDFDIYMSPSGSGALIVHDLDGNDLRITPSGAAAFLSVSGSDVIRTDEEVQVSGAKIFPDGGVAVYLTNNDGVTISGGCLVEASGSMGVTLTEIDSVECIGTAHDDIAVGAGGWIVTNGIADVAMETNTHASGGNWVQTSTTERGYADATAGTPAAAPNHFEECGHCIEDVAAGGAGTHIKAKCVLHFN